MPSRGSVDETAVARTHRIAVRDQDSAVGESGHAAGLQAQRAPG